MNFAERAMLKHGRDELKRQLLEHGIAHLEGIATWRLVNGKLEITPAESFRKEVEDKS